MAMFIFHKDPGAGGPNILADRVNELESLYASVVTSGNELVHGQLGVRSMHAVIGHKGSGKSALILKVLERLRDPECSISPDVLERSRWLIFRFSGKQIGNSAAWIDAAQRMMTDSEPSRPNPYFDLFTGIVGQADQQISAATQVSLLDRLFRRDNVALYTNVVAALGHAADRLREIQQWDGASRRRSREGSAARSAGSDGKADLGGGGSVSAIEPTSGWGVEAKANVSGGVRSARAAESKSAEQLLLDDRVRVEDAVGELNRLFAALRRARIPTIFVLDDLDELVSDQGTSHEARARVLSHLLGVFNQLAPTVLIIGLRAEYRTEDVDRQFTVTELAPLTLKDGGDALNAWASAHAKDAPGRWTSDDTSRVLLLGQALLKGFQAHERVALPYRLLDVVSMLFNSGAQPQTEARELLGRFLDGQPGVRGAIEKLADVLPDPWVLDAARCAPLPAVPEGLGDNERRDLERLGLLRPVMAGDPTDPRIVVDPLVGWLAKARRG